MAKDTCKTTKPINHEKDNHHILMHTYIYSVSIREPVASETKDVEATKTELFSFTKMFIADKWQNANNALVNADEEAGVLQVASETQVAVKQGMGLGCIYDYSYNVRFRIKDNKYRVEIYDVRCTTDRTGQQLRRTTP